LPNPERRAGAEDGGRKQIGRRARTVATTTVRAGVAVPIGEAGVRSIPDPARLGRVPVMQVEPDRTDAAEGRAATPRWAAFRQA
jgi:hypothetical protein